MLIPVYPCGSDARMLFLQFPCFGWPNQKFKSDIWNVAPNYVFASGDVFPR